MAKVLIIEDEKHLNDAYQIVLKKAGYTIVAAYDGKEALDVYEKDRPDLILLDLRMPNVSGLTFLKTLNSRHKKLKAKIVVFSNYDDQKEIDEAFKLGADRYILKAWSSPTELIKIVKETLKTKK